MNVRFLLLKIRRNLHSYTKTREVERKMQWLEFENESILSFLAKYNIIVGNHRIMRYQAEVTQQDYVGDEPEIVISVLETPS
ncbi:MAG: hypothetical protein ACFFA3_10755 [Promethearchaeota archaeon]